MIVLKNLNIINIFGIHGLAQKKKILLKISLFPSVFYEIISMEKTKNFNSTHSEHTLSHSLVALLNLLKYLQY